jgi:hypothetical protein
MQLRFTLLAVTSSQRDFHPGALQQTDQNERRVRLGLTRPLDSSLCVEDVVAAYE